MKKSTKILLIIVAVVIAIPFLYYTVFSVLLVGSVVPWILKSRIFTVNTDDYNEYSFNIVPTEIKNEIAKKSNKHYYRIKDVPTDEFVMLDEVATFFQSGRGPILMKHKDFEGPLTVDTKSAELLWGYITFNSRDNPFAGKLANQEIAQIDESLVEGVVAELNSNAPAFRNFEDGHPEFVRNNLRIKFSIKEYENLVWLGDIAKQGEEYFIVVHLESRYKYSYLPCGEELSSMIDEVVKEHKLNEAEP